MQEYLFPFSWPEGLYGGRHILSITGYTADQRGKFPIKNVNEGAYPHALVCCITERGSGQIADFKIDSRAQSELALFNQLHKSFKEDSLFLMDALYCCYETMGQRIQRKQHFVSPNKGRKKAAVMEEYADNDEIIRIDRRQRRSGWADENPKLPDSLTLRRIKCLSPLGNEYELYTSILDKKITAQEIQMLYATG